jgi:hypothetical protein
MAGTWSSKWGYGQHRIRRVVERNSLDTGTVAAVQPPSESDFDSAPQPNGEMVMRRQAYRQTVTYQGVALFAVLSIAWPVLEMSWPAPAAVWQAPRSGAIPKNASRTRLESAIFLDMKFTLWFRRWPRQATRV